MYKRGGMLTHGHVSRPIDALLEGFWGVFPTTIRAKSSLPALRGHPDPRAVEGWKDVGSGAGSTEVQHPPPQLLKASILAEGLV